MGAKGNSGVEKGQVGPMTLLKLLRHRPRETISAEHTAELLRVTPLTPRFFSFASV
jgi:hypothetical protein